MSIKLEVVSYKIHQVHLLW